MLIFVKKKTPRITYITDFIIRQLLGQELIVTDNIHIFQRSEDAKINYSLEVKSKDEFFLPPYPLLFQTNIHQQDTNITNLFELVCLFKVTDSQSDLPFDLFAAAFWLITRYEEYLPTDKDSHGRFNAVSSLAYQEGFLHLPIVHLWVNHFFSALKNKFPNLIDTRSKTFHFKASYDIDMAWAYRQKGLIRTVGGALQDMRRGYFSEVYNRLLVLTKRKIDPFDSFNFLEDLHQKYNIHPIFFFLLGNYGKFDKNVSHENKSLILLIQKIHQKYSVGIHPSYASNENPQQVENEIDRLRHITQKNVVDSRQHFLKLSFPDTYRQLIKCGIKNDYSMGYAADIGFRAGVALPFLWYDLEREETTDLMIHPFQVMDVTLRNYLKLNPDEAFEQVSKIIDATKSVGGTFMTLWHNSSFAERDGWNAEWKELYKKIVAAALEASTST